ncbi:MAG: ferredoxin [Mycobacterium sp.]|nr:ferredoxin [Mycobacterium sp.]
MNRCLGYAQCVPLAPEVLQLQGEEALAYDPNPDVSQRQQVARIKMLVEHFALDDAVHAYHLLHDGKIQGRAVITPHG